MACPDCAAYNGSYLSIPFHVRIRDTAEKGYASTQCTPDDDYVETSDVAYSMFPTLNGSRSRDLISHNRVIAGVLLTQKRKTMGSCSGLSDATQKFFFGDCQLKDLEDSKDPFGLDPTFDETRTTLYRRSNRWCDYYDSAELKPGTSQVPYSFFFDGGCTDDCDARDFPILFDVNFNQSRALKFYDLLQEANYIDDGTNELEVVIPVMNFGFNHMVYMKVTFRRALAGGWKMMYTIRPLELEYYSQSKGAIVGSYVGLAVGAVLFFLWGVFRIRPGATSFDIQLRPEGKYRAFIYAIPGAATGAVIGAIIGGIFCGSDIVTTADTQFVFEMLFLWLLFTLIIQEVCFQHPSS